MDLLIYWPVLGLVKFLQSLPLRWVARIGRAAGGVAYWLDRRHRRVALRNLAASFAPERTPAEIRALARENFRRIGENYCCAVKTAALTYEQLRQHVQFSCPPELLLQGGADGPRSAVVALGHFGNFELYARVGQFLPQFRAVTTFRSLGQRALDRILLHLRCQSGCRFFERRGDLVGLKATLRPPGVMLGLLCDQNAGPGGLRLPFLGRDCSTSAAPALFALRYHCRLFTAICYRVALARWRIEVGPEIPTTQGGHSRPLEAIMRDVNAALEQAVRRDPANWFWVHNRWKQRDFNSKSDHRHALASAPLSSRRTVGEG